MHLRNSKIALHLLPEPRHAVLSVFSGGGHHWHGNDGAGGAGNDRTSRCSFHTYASKGGGSWRREEKDEQKQKQQRFRMMANKSEFHSTATNDKSAVALMLGFGALAAVSYAGAQGVKAYNEFMASLPPPPPDEEPIQDDEANNAKQQPQQQEQQQARANTQQQKGKEKRRENIFAQWFDVGSKYYEGGFEDKMTKSEAALILGIRESSPTQRIKEAHKRLVVLNHPDTGGSTYMAGKINEAKELLLKGRMDK